MGSTLEECSLACRTAGEHILRAFLSLPLLSPHVPPAGHSRVGVETQSLSLAKAYAIGTCILLSIANWAGNLDTTCSVVIMPVGRNGHTGVEIEESIEKQQNSTFLRECMLPVTLFHNITTGCGLPSGTPIVFLDTFFTELINFIVLIPFCLLMF